MNSVPRPVWMEDQLKGLLGRQAHALLLQGPSGLGQYDLALWLAQSWLCESSDAAELACGNCASCHLVQSHTHPDLRVLLPETQMLDLGWALDEKAQKEIDEKKRKPSKDIRVEALRQAIEFCQLSSARGLAKVVVVYPAERMNHVSANALLKTLEEPAPLVRFVLASEAAHQLLPTIRSRCQTHTMAWPQPEQARHWLESIQPGASGLLQAAGMRPGLALEMFGMSHTPQTWHQWPKRLQTGQAAELMDLSPASLLDLLMKLCHDLWLNSVGAQPRYFLAEDLPPAPTLNSLQAWSVSLQQHMKSIEHPFHVTLANQALLTEAQAAINSRH